MIRTRVILIICYVIVFGAGVGVAMLTNESPTDPKPQEERSRFAEELGLTEEQSESVKKVWSDARERSRERDWREEKAQLREQREQAVAELLGESKHADYLAIREQFDEQSRALDEERHAIFKEAREKMMALMTPEQREKLEEMEKNRRSSHRRGRDREERPKDQQEDKAESENSTIEKEKGEQLQ